MSPSAPASASSARASAPAKPAAPSRSAAAAPAAAKTGAAPDTASASRAGRGSARGGREKPGAREKGARSSKGGARKGPLPLLLACVGLLAVGGAVYWFFLRPKPAVTPPAEQQPAEAAPAQDAQASVEDAGASPSAAPVASASPEAAPAEAPAARAPAPKQPEVVDPSSIDLGALPDYQRFPGTSDEEWQQLEQWSRAMLDPSGGAAQSRAMRSLEQAGRKAFPAILNAFKSLDFSNEAGVQAGKLCQRTLMNICNGTNFDWKDGIAPKDIVFNKKVVQAWATQWERCQTDDPESNAYWARFSKTEKKEGEKPPEDEGSALDEI